MIKQISMALLMGALAACNGPGTSQLASSGLVDGESQEDCIYRVKLSVLDGNLAIEAYPALLESECGLAPTTGDEGPAPVPGDEGTAEKKECVCGDPGPVAPPSPRELCFNDVKTRSIDAGWTDEQLTAELASCDAVADAP